MTLMFKALICITHLTFALIAPDEPQTVAERSGYQATARYDEVMAFIDKLKPLAPQLRVGELGKSSEGRSIPLLILADPPVATAKEAAASGKPVAFAFGNIHAGEVCGKEALLMLAREIGTTPDHPLLKDLVIVTIKGRNLYRIHHWRGVLVPRLEYHSHGAAADRFVQPVFG